MRLTFAAVGRFRREPLQEVFESYTRRLSWPLDLKEVVARKPGDAAAVRQEEGRLLLDACPADAALVALDARGKALSSQAFAGALGDWQDRGTRAVAFAIGGADGLAPEVLGRAELTLSLGPMTWPHMLVRVMLVEQIYRAQCILSGHPYHR